MQEMVIYGVSFDMVGKQPIILLKSVDGNEFLGLVTRTDLLNWLRRRTQQ